MPEEERYDGYLQLENGVGMLRLMMDEFEEEMARRKKKDGFPDFRPRRELSIATGKLAFPYIRRMARRLEKSCPGLKVLVYPITNFFFGELITVSGLITGQDLLAQLRGKALGQCLLLPENVLRSGEDVFLDDCRLPELERALQVPINIVKSSGKDFVESILAAGMQACAESEA